MTKQFCNLNSDYLHEDLHSLHWPFNHKTYYISLFCRLEGKLRYWLMPCDFPLLSMPCDLPPADHVLWLQSWPYLMTLPANLYSPCTYSLFWYLPQPIPLKVSSLCQMHLSPVPYPFLFRMYFWSMLKATFPCKPQTNLSFACHKGLLEYLLTILIKILAGFLAQIDMLVLKLVRKCKGPKISKTVFKK